MTHMCACVRLYTSNIQETFRERSENIHGTFREHTVNIQLDIWLSPKGGSRSKATHSPPLD